jgi:hypothetical protein
MATAITALACIGITVGLYDRQPLYTWPHSIKLNTVLSTLATVMKGFMLVPVCASLGQLKWLWYSRQSKPLHDFQLFDIASRGPWGALRLLIRLKFWHAASIGSLVTLLTLASDAFVQQSVSYPLLPQPQNNIIATIPYTQSFSQYEKAPDGAAFSSKPIMAAIYDGVFAQNLTQSGSSITAQCPTGNCTFNSYASLAVCSHCHNVTSLLKYYYNSNVDPDGSSLGTIYIYSLPNGLSLISGESAITYINISSSLPPSSNALDAYQSTGTILNMSIITGGTSEAVGEQTAWDCVLIFCAKSYEASENLGFFNENVVDVYDKPSWTGNTALLDASFTFEVPPTHLTTIGDWNRTFSINNIALATLQDSLPSSLEGEGGITVTGTMVFTSDIAQAFYYNGLNNVPRTIANIADSLTNAMRMISHQQVNGTAEMIEVYIHVQWLWLLLPLIMVLLAVVFFGLTVWQSDRSGVPSWRSSALAVMGHGLNAYMLEDSGIKRYSRRSDVIEAAVGKERSGDLDVWAEEVEVLLRRRGDWGKGFGLTVT